MVIKEFDYYLKNQLVKKKFKDPQEAKSLFRQAKARISFVETLLRR